MKKITLIYPPHPSEYNTLKPEHYTQVLGKKVSVYTS